MIFQSIVHAVHAAPVGDVLPKIVATVSDVRVPMSSPNVNIPCQLSTTNTTINCPQWQFPLLVSAIEKNTSQCRSHCCNQQCVHKHRGISMNADQEKATRRHQSIKCEKLRSVFNTQQLKSKQQSTKSLFTVKTALTCLHVLVPDDFCQ